MYVWPCLRPENNFWTKWLSTLTFGVLVYPDTVWVTFKGQGYRSKFKVTVEQNVAKVVGWTSSEGFF